MSERKRPKRPAGDYPVGYGKPPAEHQFKKGQPRPPRKPKPKAPAPSFEAYLAAELTEPMRIVENGVEQYVPKGKALAKASIKGAIQQKDPRRLKGFLPPPSGPEDFDFSDIDLAIVARFMAQVLKRQALPGSDDGDSVNGEGGPDTGDGHEEGAQ